MKKSIAKGYLAVCFSFAFFLPLESSLADQPEEELGYEAVCELIDEEAKPLTLLAFDSDGTPVGDCPDKTVTAQACVRNTFGDKASRWWKATVDAATEAAKAKFEQENGSSDCQKTTTKCKLCTRSSGMKTGKCTFSPSETAGLDDLDNPQADRINGSENTWLDPKDDELMCAEVTFGCPYGCKV